MQNFHLCSVFSQLLSHLRTAIQNISEFSASENSIFLPGLFSQGHASKRKEFYSIAKWRSKNSADKRLLLLLHFCLPPSDLISALPPPLILYRGYRHNFLLLLFGFFSRTPDSAERKSNRERIEGTEVSNQDYFFFLPSFLPSSSYITHHHPSYCSHRQTL